MNAIECVNLTKRFGDITAVDSLNLTIGKGELFSLLGVNGAGKTTLIKMLSLLTEPTEGEAFVKGWSVRKDKKMIKRIIALSPQETAIADNLTVMENLEFMASLYFDRKAEIKRRTEKMLDELSLECVSGRKAGKLSGGWKRRLNIAMALISEPEILFLDEPTLALDVIARSELWEYINSLRGKMTIILTTHYLEEAEALSDRVAIMKNGRIIETGTPQEITDRSGENNFQSAFIKIAGGRI